MTNCRCGEGRTISENFIARREAHLCYICPPVTSGTPGDTLTKTYYYKTLEHHILFGTSVFLRGSRVDPYQVRACPNEKNSTEQDARPGEQSSLKL